MWKDFCESFSFLWFFWYFYLAMIVIKLPILRMVYLIFFFFFFHIRFKETNLHRQSYKKNHKSLAKCLSESPPRHSPMSFPSSGLKTATSRLSTMRSRSRSSTIWQPSTRRCRNRRRSSTIWRPLTRRNSTVARPGTTAWRGRGSSTSLRGDGWEISSIGGIFSLFYTLHLKL